MNCHTLEAVPKNVENSSGNGTICPEDHLTAESKIGWDAIEKILQDQLVVEGFPVNSIKTYIKNYKKLVMCFNCKPTNVTSEKLKSIFDSKLEDTKPKVVLSHLMILMIDLKLWPRHFMFLRKPERKMVVKYIDSEWQRLFDKFEGYLDSEDMHHSTRFRTLKWAGHFLWWAKLKYEDVFDPSILVKNWQEFTKEIHEYSKKMDYQNVFKRFCDFLLKTGQLIEEPDLSPGDAVWKKYIDTNDKKYLPNLSEDWPRNWDEVWPVFVLFITRQPLFPHTANCILSGFESVVKKLPVTPRQITKEHIAKVLELPEYKKKFSGAFSHLCLLLIELKVWPKEFLPRNTAIGNLRKRFSPIWKKFSDEFQAYLIREGVPKDQCYLWTKWIITFIWWSDFTDKWPLDSEQIKVLWEQFGQFLTHWTRDIASYSPKTFSRAFSLFWNFAITQKTIVADPVPIERVATSFWSHLQEPLRVPLHL